MHQPHLCNVNQICVKMVISAWWLKLILRLMQKTLVVGQLCCERGCLMAVERRILCSAELCCCVCCRKLVGVVDVVPPVRLKESRSRMVDVRRQAELAPCGNFTAVYRCMCDYHSIEFMEDVAWVSFFYFCGYFVRFVSFCMFSVNFPIFYRYYPALVLQKHINRWSISWFNWLINIDLGLCCMFSFFFILLCNKQSRQTCEINSGEVQEQK